MSFVIAAVAVVAFLVGLLVGWLWCESAQLGRRLRREMQITEMLGEFDQ